MGLTYDELLPAYKASLNDAASVFKGTDADADADFKRHLDVAARALSRRKRPRTLLGTLTLVADQADYEAPADLLLPKAPVWSTTRAIWDLPTGPLPALLLLESDSQRLLSLRPSPSAALIASYGETLRYYYLAAHAITDEASTSTVQERDLDLLSLRAQVEAMRELAFRGYAKPVTLRGGGGAPPTRNQTPAALYERLQAEFEAHP